MMLTSLLIIGGWRLNISPKTQGRFRDCGELTDMVLLKYCYYFLKSVTWVGILCIILSGIQLNISQCSENISALIEPDALVFYVLQWTDTNCWRRHSRSDPPSHRRPSMSKVWPQRVSVFPVAQYKSWGECLDVHICLFWSVCIEWWHVNQECVFRRYRHMPFEEDVLARLWNHGHLILYQFVP